MVAPTAQSFTNYMLLAVVWRAVVAVQPAQSSPQAAPSADAERRRLEETKKFMAGHSSTTAFYPAVSMFGRAKVRFNAGPDFAFGMPAGARPMSDRAN